MTIRHLALLLIACVSIATTSACSFKSYKSHAISVANTDDRIFIRNGKATGAVCGVYLQLDGVPDTVPSLKQNDDGNQDSRTVTLMIGTQKIDFVKSGPEIAISVDGTTVGTAGVGGTLALGDGKFSIVDNDAE